MPSFLSVFFQGFLLQASLILALGAQNIFVLNAGLRRQHPLLVATVSTLCDVLLIFVGVLGVASVFVQIPALKIGLGILGAGFLLYYGILKLREAKDGVTQQSASFATTSRKQTLLTTIGFSLLNPHVYLDTVVLIGGYSTKFHDFSDRFYFGAGASAFSAIWFTALVLLASMGSNLLQNKNAMRTISLISGLILCALAIKLGADVLAWIQY